MPSFWPSRAYRRKRRKTAVIGSLLISLVFVLTVSSHGRRTGSVTMQDSRDLPSVASAHEAVEDHAKFWRSLYTAILNNDPQCQYPPEVVIPEKLDIAYEDDHIHNRPDVLWMNEPDIQRMKIAHQNFLDDIRAAQQQLVFEKGTRGIITTVSDTQIPILLIQLRMLRSTDSLLPVEVFLSQPTPYTDHVCQNILVGLNATCIYYSHIFTAAGTGVSVSTYQYKIFAILFSTFDEILLLDCDAWPLSNPDHLFTYPPFSTTGLVLWPDFWYASESPYFFDIAKIPDPPMLHTKPATESGELMYAKSKHETSILLAAYYNYYGPGYYYPLQSQGAPGQGDKETFGCAALALHEEFYWVRTPVTAIGRMDSSGDFVGSAMVQYDPIVDFQHHNPHHHHTAAADAADAAAEPPGRDPSLSQQQKSQQGIPPKVARPPSHTNKPLFIHANFPKFDPRTILDERPPRDTNGSWVRCWQFGAESATDRFGFDLERRFWSAIRAVACEDLVDRGTADPARHGKELETCRRVESYVHEVFGQ